MNETRPTQSSHAPLRRELACVGAALLLLVGCGSGAETTTSLTEASDTADSHGSTDTPAPDLPADECGNGVVDDGEECDDAADGCDGCTDDCKIPSDPELGWRTPLGLTDLYAMDMTVAGRAFVAGRDSRGRLLLVVAGAEAIRRGRVRRLDRLSDRRHDRDAGHGRGRDRCGRRSPLHPRV